MELNYIEDFNNKVFLYDRYEEYKNNNLFIDKQERKVTRYKFKLTPHYFDLKCRLDSSLDFIFNSKGLLEDTYDTISCNFNKNIFDIHNSYNYILNNLLWYQTWFDYWKIGFIKKSIYNRTKYSIARTRQTLFDLCSCNFIKGHSLFLTLTYDINHKLDSTIYNTLGAFNYEQALKDIKHFCKSFKRVFGESMKYVYFIEQQNGKHNSYNFFTGAFHFHILIFNGVYFKQGLKHKNCKENAQKIWGRGIAYVEKIPQRNINNTCKYISKYISKDTLCVDRGSHALHSSKGLNRPVERNFFDIPYRIDNIISLELMDNLGLCPSGFNPSELVPYKIDIDSGHIIGYDMSTFKTNKIVIHSRYIDLLIMRLPSFDNTDKPIMNNKCDLLVKVHCDLDYRKNFFKKRCDVNRRKYTGRNGSGGGAELCEA